MSNKAGAYFQTEGGVRPTLLDRWSRTSNEVLLVKVLENMKSPNVSAVRQSSDSIERDHAGRTRLKTKSKKMPVLPDNASEGYEETSTGLSGTVASRIG